MNLAQLQQKLLAAARSQKVSDAVPYAFEKRILARLAPVARVDAWLLWARALWRAAVPCVAVMLLLGTWSLLTPGSGNSSPTDLSQEMENTVLAVVDQDQPAESW